MVPSTEKFFLDWISNYFHISTCRAEAKESSYSTCSGKLPFRFFFLQITPLGPQKNNSTNILLFIANKLLLWQMFPFKFPAIS